MSHSQVASEFQSRVRAACDAILSEKFFQPRVGIILGSGLGKLADHVAHPHAIRYQDVPHFPKSFAAGHAGRLILGHLAGLPCMLMQGRSHRYEGFTNSQIQFPVHCMRELGVQLLIVTNAAGGLNPRFQMGNLMVIDQHLNFLFSKSALPEFVLPDSLGPIQSGVLQRGASPYDHGLCSAARRIARGLDIELHQGTYLATLGPTYETRHEYRMFRSFGADAVGMSTVPEVLAAQQLGMRVVAFSVITNVACTDIPQNTSHAEVVDVGNQAGPHLLKIVCGLLDELAGQPD